MRLGYLEPELFEKLDLQVRQIAAPLYGLIARVRRGNRLLSQGVSAICWLLMGAALL